MSTDTYIGIIFSIAITFVFTHFYSKIKKLYIKILIPIIFVIIATVIYKFNDLTIYSSELFPPFLKCTTFLLNTLKNINNISDSASIIVPSIYMSLLINFYIEYSVEKKYFYESLSYILYFVGLIIYIIVTGLFFIWAYYLLFNTKLHIISYIVFSMIFISSFFYKHILFFLLSIQRKIEDNL